MDWSGIFGLNDGVVELRDEIVVSKLRAIARAGEFLQREKGLVGSRPGDAELVADSIQSDWYSLRSPGSSWRRTRGIEQGGAKSVGVFEYPVVAAGIHCQNFR